MPEFPPRCSIVAGGDGNFIDQWFQFGRPSGIRIGSARDGTVQAYIADPCPYPYPGISSMAEGVTVDADGNVYGAKWLGKVRKYVRK